MNGLEINDLDNFSHLLTGYVGSLSFLEQVYAIVTKLKKKNPDLVYGNYFIAHISVILLLNFTIFLNETSKFVTLLWEIMVICMFLESSLKCIETNWFH